MRFVITTDLPNVIVVIVTTIKSNGTFLLHSTRRSIIRIQRPHDSLIDDRSMRARDGHLIQPFFATLRKYRSPYDFDEPWENEGRIIGRPVFEQSSHGLWSTMHARVKVKERTIVAGCHRIVNRFVIARIVRSFGPKGWHNGNFRNGAAAFIAYWWTYMIFVLNASRIFRKTSGHNLEKASRFWWIVLNTFHSIFMQHRHGKYNARYDFIRMLA